MYRHLDDDTRHLDDLLADTLRHAREFLGDLPTRPAAVEPQETAAEPLAEEGVGGRAALERFLERYGDALAASAGPRYFGFVTGGATPAALAGDWLASAVDQNALLGGDTVAPFVEREAVGFLRELFTLPEEHTGVFVSGATTANFTGLAVARQHLAARRGVDVAEEGLCGLPPLTVLSGSPHSSIGKALAMLGLGRRHLRAVATLPGREAVDPEALEAALAAQEGRPTVVVANAGTASTGDFDDLAAVTRLCRSHDTWLHVDGAFGLFAAASPRLRHLVDGVGAADSIVVDHHKWLNTPYDSATLFTRHLDRQLEVFQNRSAYLAPPEPLPHHYLHLVPENSRRFRALAAWVTLVAYGRAGYREMVERNCRLAAGLADRLDADPRFEVLTPVRLNVLCFTLPGAGEERVRAYLDALRRDGRTFFSSTRLHGRHAVRGAFCNWRTGDEDLDTVYAALGEVADRL